MRIVSPSITQRALKRLVLAFAQLRRRKVASIWCAPFDVILSPTRVVEPDLLVIRKERRSIITRRAVEGAPDLCASDLAEAAAAAASSE